MGSVKAETTVPVGDPSRPAIPIAGRLGGRRARSARRLVAAAVVVVLVRWWTSHRRVVFHINPDEPGQLAIGRTIGGAARWNMFDHSTWRPGFGTLIAPIWWFTHDPVTTFRAALGMNAVLGGISFALLYVLARRLTAMSPRACVAAALVVSLSPAVLFTTDWVWSEALVQVTFLACLLAMLQFQAVPSVGAGAAMVVLAAAGYAAHSRLLPLAVVAVGLVAVSGARGHLAPSRAVGLLAMAVGSLYAVEWYSDAVVDRVWENPSRTNSVGGVLDRLTQLGPVAVSALGQTWYQLVATAGLVAVGAVILIRSLRRDRDARVVVATVGSLVALSVVFMADRWRPDHLVYGRYNDAVLGPVVLVGIGALVTSRSVSQIARLGAVAAAAIVATGALLHGLRGDELAADGGVRAMILGLQPFLSWGDAVPVGRITALAVIVGGVVVGAASLGRMAGRRGWGVAALAVLLVIGYGRTRALVDGNLNAWERSAAVDAPSLPPGVPVRIRDVPDHLQMLYQYSLPENEVVRDGAPDRPTPFVLAPLDDAVLVGSGAAVVWRDPEEPIALWVEVTSR
jgi:hypothetical protein